MTAGNRMDDFVDYQALTPEQWAAFKARVLQNARRHRSLALKALLGRTAAVIGRAAAAAGTHIAAIWIGYAAWRIARSDFAALSALDDSTLKDIGIARSEIESIVRKPHDPTRHAHFKKAA